MDTLPHSETQHAADISANLSTDILPRDPDINQYKLQNYSETVDHDKTCLQIIYDTLTNPKSKCHGKTAQDCFTLQNDRVLSFQYCNGVYGCQPGTNLKDLKDCEADAAKSDKYCSSTYANKALKSAANPTSMESMQITDCQNVPVWPPKPKPDNCTD